MSVDLRRHRTEVKEACEVVLPLVFAWAMPAVAHPEGGSMLPLHMPTFMREKDFVELYLPTLKIMLQKWLLLVCVRSCFAKMTGVGISIFCWMNSRREQN